MATSEEARTIWENRQSDCRALLESVLKGTRKVLRGTILAHWKEQDLLHSFENVHNYLEGNSQAMEDFLAQNKNAKRIYTRLAPLVKEEVEKENKGKQAGNAAGGSSSSSSSLANNSKNAPAAAASSAAGGQKQKEKEKQDKQPLAANKGAKSSRNKLLAVDEASSSEEEDAMAVEGAQSEYYVEKGPRESMYSDRSEEYNEQSPHHVSVSLEAQGRTAVSYFSDFGVDEEGRADNTRKNPPSPFQKEVSDAGFACTNQVCLAVEDCRLLPSLSREVSA